LVTEGGLEDGRIVEIAGAGRDGGFVVVVGTRAGRGGEIDGLKWLLSGDRLRGAMFGVTRFVGADGAAGLLWIFGGPAGRACEIEGLRKLLDGGLAGVLILGVGFGAVRTDGDGRDGARTLGDGRAGARTLGAGLGTDLTEDGGRDRDDEMAGLRLRNDGDADRDGDRAAGAAPLFGGAASAQLLSNNSGATQKRKVLMRFPKTGYGRRSMASSPGPGLRAIRVCAEPPGNGSKLCSRMLANDGLSGNLHVNQY
jgi:hypothetical protein